MVFYGVATAGPRYSAWLLCKLVVKILISGFFEFPPQNFKILYTNMEAIQIRNTTASFPLMRKSIQPSKRLCRNLFGPIDHDEVKVELDRELNKDLNRKCEEWCFNFTDETPILGGNLIWEEVEERKVKRPESTPLTIINEDRRVPQLHSEKSEQDNDVFLSPPTFEARAFISTRSRTAANFSSPQAESKAFSVVEKKRKRPCKSITDFMKQKKRRRVSNSSALEKHSQAGGLSNGCCAKDDLALSNTAKKARVMSES